MTKKATRKASATIVATTRTVVETETLVRLTAPTRGNRQGFCCGIVVINGVVRDAAPIVRGMIGWSSDSVRNYCKAVGWKATIVKELEAWPGRK